MPPSKGPRWNPAATNELIGLFNLFTSTGGQEGCDPRNQESAYVIEQLKENDYLRQFLQSNHGGHPAHKKDSAKATRGYKRAASEYITFLAKDGIRRKDYRTLLRTAPAAHPRSVVVLTPYLSLQRNTWKTKR
jgi:hypothetical protein